MGLDRGQGIGSHRGPLPGCPQMGVTTQRGERSSATGHRVHVYVLTHAANFTRREEAFKWERKEVGVTLVLPVYQGEGP